MEQKTKFIIIGLGIFLAIFIVIAILTFINADTLRSERDKIKSAMEILNQNLEMASQEGQKLRAQITEKTDELNKLSQDKDQLLIEKEDLVKQKDTIQGRYDAIAKERDELVEKLKTQAAQPEEKPKEESAAAGQDRYWAGVLKDKTELSLVVENMRSELSTLKIKNDQLTKDLSNLSREKDELEQQVNYNQKMFDTMAAELVLERNAKRALQANAKSVKNENSLLRRQLKSLNNRQVELENKLVKIQAQKGEIERRFNEMADVLEDRLSRVSEIKEQLENVRSGSGGQISIAPTGQDKTESSVELAPIVVRPDQGEKYSFREGEIPPLRGRILEVNKENKFVIIDIGQDSGVKMGDVFQVYNMEGRAIANIETIQVRPRISACDVTRETAPIIVGDAVR